PRRAVLHRARAARGEERHRGAGPGSHRAAEPDGTTRLGQVVLRQSSSRRSYSCRESRARPRSRGPSSGAAPAPGPGASSREEAREEPLDAVAEADRAVAGVGPGGPRGRLGRLPRLLQLLPAVLRAFGDRVADALGGLPDAFPDLAVGDLLRPALDLLGGRLHLRVVGGEGESGCEQHEREREHQDQTGWFHRGAPFLTAARATVPSMEVWGRSPRLPIGPWPPPEGAEGR